MVRIRVLGYPGLSVYLTATTWTLDERNRSGPTNAVDLSMKY